MLNILKDVQKLGRKADRAQKKRTGGGGSAPARPQGGAAGSYGGRGAGVTQRQDRSGSNIHGLLGKAIGHQVGVDPPGRHDFFMNEGSARGGGMLRAGVDDFDSMFNGLPSSQKMAEDKLLGRNQGKAPVDLSGSGNSDHIEDLLAKSINGKQVIDDQAEKLKREKSDAERSQRAKLIGLDGNDAPTATSDSVESRIKELTPEQYSKLTPRQRSAVDFNTTLAAAVAEDLANQDEYEGVDKSQRNTYNTAVSEMFGKGRGSDLYAPETVAVLRSLNLDTKGADLDDYLGLQAAITEDDLGLLETARPVQTALPKKLGGDVVSSLGNRTGKSDERYDYVNTLADHTERMEKTLAEGNALLNGFSAGVQRTAATDAGLFGANEDISDAPGAGFSQEATEFNELFDILANKNLSDSPQAVLAEVSPNMSEDQWTRFATFAERRLNSAERYKTAITENTQIEPRDAAELRSVLGLKGG